MSASVATADGVLEIRFLDVTDDIVVTYIDHLEPEARAAGVINCVELGARALTFASDQTGAALLADSLKTSTESHQSLLNEVSRTAEQSVAKSTETIEKAVAKQLAELENELGKKLDPENAASVIGKLRAALLDDYGNVTAKLRRELDLANPQSPLSALRSELLKEEERRYEALREQLNALLQQLAAKAAANAERSKSARKGGDFETAAEEFLMAESGPRKDLARRTTNTFGLDQNQVGDFVVEINPSDSLNARIVIETKNGHRGITELERELSKAMKNRAAGFGIAVVGDSAIVSQAITAYGDDKLIVRVPALSAGEWDFTALGVALDCARWKTVMAPLTAGSLDVRRVKADVEAAFKVANRFAAAKQKITASRTQLDGISEYLDDIKRELETLLCRIRDTVSEGRARPEAA